MIQPLVSLLVANFNNGKYVNQTLQSAVNQTYNNIEIIIIDDASTDNSVEIINDFILKNKNFNIKFIQNKNNSGGCGSIKRQCIEKSNGQYFAFLDPEDTITPDAVEQLMDIHLQNIDTYSIVYCTHYLCDENLEPHEITDWAGKIPDGESHLTSTGGHISAFAVNRRADYDKTTGINPAYIVAEDMDLYLKMEEIAPVLFVDKLLYFYRKHDHNASWDYQKRYRNLFWRHTAEKAAYIRRKNHNTAAKNLTISQLHKLNFAYFMQMAKFERSQKHFLKSVIYNIKAIPYCYTMFF
ncbi:MAG: glycosyltransferase family 2 protein [Paludibacter sp.]|nr:glycosyltransferase family 2 protein [Paludibacter sp.]